MVSIYLYHFLYHFHWCFTYISKNQKAKIPNPEIQIFGGGAHAANSLTFQDFLIYSPIKIPFLRDSI